MTTLKDKIRDVLYKYDTLVENGDKKDIEGQVEEIIDEIKDWIR
jgi:hypothetical protein